MFVLHLDPYLYICMITLLVESETFQ
jgi:hypothetical protein